MDCDYVAVVQARSVRQPPVVTIANRFTKALAGAGSGHLIIALRPGTRPFVDQDHVAGPDQTLQRPRRMHPLLG